jgi:peroxiredoxin
MLAAQEVFMQDQKRPLQPGEPVPAFTLPSANREGLVSLADLRGRAFLIGFYRGLHCPFCRRQVVQLASLQPALREAGVDILAVINTPLERARLYFRHRPTPVLLLSDPDCMTHQAFGVPHIEFVPDDASAKTQWPYTTTMAQFMAARNNPNGVFPAPLQPLESNAVLNAKEGFEMLEADNAIVAAHGTQLAGHFLVDGDGIVRWTQIEAPDGPNDLGTMPSATQILAAVGSLAR